MSEISSARQMLFAKLAATPHRVLGPTVKAFQTALIEDGDFAARALAYFASTSTINDIRVASVIALLTADDQIYREAGRAILGFDFYKTKGEITGLEPFFIFRALSYLASPWVVVNGDVEIERFMTEKSAHKSLARIASRIHAHESELWVRRDLDHRSSPRLARKFLMDYMRFLSANTKRLDGIVMTARHQLVDLCRHYHVPLNDEVNNLLFKDEPPVWSKRAIVKQIAKETDPEVKARLAVENKIPALVTASLLGKETLTAKAATLMNMTPTQARNAAKKIEESGMLDVPELAKIFYDKIENATKSVASIGNRKSTQAVSEPVKAALDAARQKAIDNSPIVIKNDLLIGVDKSWSMQDAIELAKKVCPHVAAYCHGEMRVAVFDDVARVLTVAKPTEMAAWERAMRAIKAGNQTSMREALAVGLRDWLYPGEVLFITDGGENSPADGAADFIKTREIFWRPRVTILKVGNYSERFAESLREVGCTVQEFAVTDDYTSFDQLARLLSGEKGQSLAQTIYEKELPSLA